VGTSGDDLSSSFDSSTDSQVVSGDFDSSDSSFDMVSFDFVVFFFDSLGFDVFLAAAVAGFTWSWQGGVVKLLINYTFILSSA